MRGKLKQDLHLQRKKRIGLSMRLPAQRRDEHGDQHPKKRIWGANIEADVFIRGGMFINFLCFIGRHKWKACKCIACSRTRSEQHTWVGGRCACCNVVWSKEDALEARQKAILQKAKNPPSCDGFVADIYGPPG